MCIRDRYTGLCDDEIQVIKDAAKSLPAIASMFNADAFIDCQMNDGSGDAIVVYEAKPIDSPSSYEKTVVGLVASKEKEPAVHRTFQLSVPTKFMKAVTQENAHAVSYTHLVFLLQCQVLALWQQRPWRGYILILRGL